MEKIIITILSVIVLIIAITFCIHENNKYIYECTDYKGDIVYCKFATNSKGGMYGTTIDGTTITITSYRLVLKEECL